ncbi:uncharacterized protein LOC101770843 [Setaria italica]|uniref:uncharacterized protein LOC101770843 n=1 Tax=Setaria italica TaxID=4555 RepID=UPI0003509815|nr:uncharacterized protein LOC101770843 [Setaria italica]
MAPRRADEGSGGSAYIAELRDRAEQLETEARQASIVTMVAATHPFAGGNLALALEENLEVRMLGREAAALRLTTTEHHGPASIMVALRSRDLAVQHACVRRVGGTTVQDAVVDIPATLLHKLQQKIEERWKEERRQGCIRLFS